jgi:HlyD family secretion protein
MKSRKKILIPLVLLVLVGAGYFVWTRVVRPEKTGGPLEASGTVEATDALIGFEIPGTIATVLVEEGDTVTAGSEVARLRTEELEAQRAQAQARIDAARARLRELETGSRRQEIAQARAEVAAAEETLEERRRDLDRTERLFHGGAVGREAYDRAETAAEVASSRLDQAKEQLALVREGPRKEQIEAQRAVLGEAQAALDAIDARLGKTTLTAPFAGRVTVRHKEPGEIAAVGAPVITLQNPQDRWVRIYIPEDRLGAVHLGGTATILSDTYPGKRYPGRIDYISDQAEFTPKNVQTKEERVRLVYAVKVRVTDDPGFELKPGMPVDVEIPEGAAAETGGSEDGPAEGTGSAR